MPLSEPAVHVASFNAGATQARQLSVDDRPNDGASESRGPGEGRRKRQSRLASRHRQPAPRSEGHQLRIFRYRKPSRSNLLGATAAKRSVKRSLGIFQVQGFIEPSRLKQKIKYRAGLYTPVARAIRQTAKGKFRAPFGL